MGFSPGKFEVIKVNVDQSGSFTRKTATLHFERKAGNHIVLWNDDESVLILELDLNNAWEVISQLGTLLHTEV